MEKENVFEQVPPKVWVAAGVGVVLLLALLIWLLTSSNNKANHSVGEDGGALPSSEALNVSPDIPDQRASLADGASADGTGWAVAASDSAPSDVAIMEALESSSDTEMASFDTDDTMDDTIIEEDRIAAAPATTADELGEGYSEPEDVYSEPEVIASGAYSSVADSAAEDNSPVSASESSSEPSSLSLVDSDSAVRRQFAYVSDTPFYKALWRPNNLLQRWVTFTFGLSKGQVMRQVVSLKTPKASFPVRRVGTRYFLDESGFDRYDTYMKTLSLVSPATWAENFHYFRPLLEKVFGQMGYDENDFDNTVTKALHEIITAEIPSGALELKAPSAMYVFVNEDIERMTPLQKQMIRMGPAHAKVLQDYAQKVRAELLKGG